MKVKSTIFLCFLLFFCSKNTNTINDKNSTNLINHPWPMFQHDAQHTGRSPYNGIEHGRVKWKVEVGAFLSAPVIDKDGIIYVGSLTDGFYAVYPDGNIKWNFPTSQKVNSTPALDKDGNIYFACGDKYFYSLDNNGNLRWKYLTNKEMDRINPTIGEDGTIYFVADSGYAFNSDGTKKWTLPIVEDLKFENPATPAIDHRGYIYMGLDNNLLSIIEPDGSIWWKIAGIGCTNVSSPVIDDNGNIYILSASSNIMYVFSKNVRNLWNVGFGREILSTPAISKDGMIYFSWYRFLTAFYPDGTEKWGWRSEGEEINNSPILDSDGNIYLAGGDCLFVISPDKKLLNTIKVERTYFLSSPVLGNNRVIYITGGRDGFLYAIE